MKKGRLIKEVSDLCGVSVRLLHHWDEMGLVSPAERLPNGYRLYSETDIKRLQQALLYRETGMSLERIKELLDRSQCEERHLRLQLSLLEEAAGQLQQKICAVHQLLEECMQGKKVNIEEKAALMGKDWLPEWEAEAKQKWGETPDWKETQENLAKMTESDWQFYRKEMQTLEEKMAALCSAGIAPASPQALCLIEEYRKVCSRHHFDITHAKHVLLGRMYTEDPRFKDYYEKQSLGLASWLRAGIDANARAHGTDPEQAEWESV